MPKTDKLKDRMKELGLRKEAVAVALHISLNTLNNKLAGRTEFTIQEVKDISVILKLSKKQSDDIFFN